MCVWFDDFFSCFSNQRIFANIFNFLFKNKNMTVYTSVIFNSTPFSESMVLSEDNYADRCLILKRFVDVGIDGGTVREQQALFALQALMHELEHPNSK